MNSDNIGDTCSYQYEEQYNLRPHRLNSGYNFAVHASTSSSQETTSYVETESYCNTDSQGTEASVIRIDRLGKFNEFLETCDISPVKCLTESLEKSSERTKRRYLSKANTCITALLNTICPDDSEFIKKSLFGEQENDKNKTTSSLLDAIVSSYMVANTPTLRRQLLSIATNDYSFAEVSASIPGLSHYKFYSAKKHAQNIGLGVPAQTSKIPRSKINDGQLDHFLDFITSNHLIKDLPIGEKTLQLSTGELIQTPNVIRSIAPATIIRQYAQLCEDENIQRLGTSTMYKILTDCSASVRQSMEGLDYYISEGSRAFTDLTETVEQLDLTLDEKKKTLDNLVVAKHYLKTDYKLHVNTSSSIADHCCSYALSEEKGPFCQKCDNHSHTDECQQCSFVDETLSFISKSAIERHWDNPEAVLFKVEKAIADIYEWKSHILRSKNQEKARQAVVNCLGENEAFMVADWAMKFLPRKFREGQTDWFGKRGINWHITVTMLKSEGSVKFLTHVHIFEQPIPQDAATTGAILVDVVQNIPSVKKVNIWSDNAGCYKSTLTIATLHQELDKKIKSYNFCEAQDGKGACDRKASHIKSAIKRYVNEGNNVTTAHQMKLAIDSQQRGQYMVKVISPVINADDDKVSLRSIPLISMLHNFKFTDNGLQVWRAYDIGQGKLISWNSIIDKKIPVIQLFVHHDWSYTQFATVGSVVVDREDDDGDDDEEDDNEDEDTQNESNDEDKITEPVPKKRRTISKIFTCPEEGCTRSFKHSSSLYQHIMVGNCNVKEEKLSLADRTKVLYAQKLEDGNLGVSFTKQSDNNNNAATDKLNKGWALKVNKPKTIFTLDQKAYLHEKFMIGKTTGRKEDPSKVAEEMRYVLKNGENRFTRSQYLTSQQIASYFSRLVQKEKKIDETDLIAATADSKCSVLKRKVLKECSL
ncbi:uncharacterized protein LOC143062528 [Mytilus galloprovincialis]|uniref:uncharacterized protein LOC143062528 n=1 Tax=Mytilus galloprovincialis TaxID=29158 RepID=UPI003F7BA199